jgi:hypothetical protein
LFSCVVSTQYCQQTFCCRPLIALQHCAGPGIARDSVHTRQAAALSGNHGMPQRALPTAEFYYFFFFGVSRL